MSPPGFFKLIKYDPDKRNLYLPGRILYMEAAASIYLIIQIIHLSQIFQIYSNLSDPEYISGLLFFKHNANIKTCLYL